MGFTLNANLSGVFAVPSGGGSTSQSLPLTQQAFTTILAGLNRDGTPAASVSNAPPAPQSPPITRTPFTLAGVVASAKRNPLVVVGVLVAAYLVYRKVIA